MAESYYVTTPIYYINDVPHLGSAYTTIAADVMARYHRLRGDDTRFLTGTDEHGLKIQRAADDKGQPPQVFADGIAAAFREAWPKLSCSFDDFIRTSEPRHKDRARDLWRAIRDRQNKPEPNIYHGHYEGLYCVGCEGYKTEKELDQPGNVCPMHKKPVEWVKEESYFFRLSAYAEDLLAFYEANPAFVEPAGRFNEVKSFVRAGLEDVSVSRTTFQWGVPVPDDERHVMYVWFDALANYRTALLAVGREDLWTSAVHLVGKDILRFHAVYWPAFLMAAGLPLPQKVFAHGFLTYCGEKMSKTLRNTVSPVGLAEGVAEAAGVPTAIGVDVVRYVLMRAISFGQDGDYSITDLCQRYASELGNTLGNLLNRVMPFAKDSPERGPDTELETELRAAYPEVVRAVTEAYQNTSPTQALSALFVILAKANEYVDKAAPWAAKKRGDTARMGAIAGTLLDVLEAASVMLAPVMPAAADAIRAQLGLGALGSDKVSLADAWPHALPRRATIHVVPGGPIFPRLEKDKEAVLVQRFSPPKAVEAEAQAAAVVPAAPATQTDDAAKASPAEAKPTISYDDFAKLDLRVGVVVSADKVKKKDKLLDLRVDTGDAAPRRIIAGIAEAYAPEALVGKHVVVLCNLAPRDFGKGLVSEGMLLAATDQAGLMVVSAGEKKAGSPVK